MWKPTNEILNEESRITTPGSERRSGTPVRSPGVRSLAGSPEQMRTQEEELEWYRREALTPLAYHSMDDSHHDQDASKEYFRKTLELVWGILTLESTAQEQFKWLQDVEGVCNGHARAPAGYKVQAQHRVNALITHQYLSWTVNRLSEGPSGWTSEMCNRKNGKYCASAGYGVWC